MNSGRNSTREIGIFSCPEVDFMTWDNEGVVTFRSDMGDGSGTGFTEMQRIVEHNADGRTLSEGRALVGEEGRLSRPFMPRYNLLPSIFRALCGLHTSQATIDGRVKTVWTYPDDSAPAIETFTFWWGTNESAYRLTGGKLVGYNIDVARNADGGSVSGNIEWHFQKLARVVNVPGADPANAVVTLELVSAEDDLVVALSVDGAAAQNITIPADSTNAEVDALVEAHTGITLVTVTGSRTNSGAEYTGTFVITMTSPAQTDLHAVKVSGAGWTVENTTFGSDGADVVYEDGPYLEPDTVRVYIATDEADLDSIDMADLPDENGNGGDAHGLWQSPNSAVGFSDLWKPIYALNASRNASDFVAGARTFTANVTVPNDTTAGSDAEYLVDTLNGCMATGFWLRRAWKCEEYELWEDFFVSRTDAPNHNADNDVWLKSFGLGGQRNPEGAGKRITLFLPA